MESITLEQIYYLAELTGVIAVVISLVYVGRQVRQNTEIMQMNAVSEQTQWSTEVISYVFNNRDTAEYWAKGKTEFDSLDDIDQQRLIVFEVGIIDKWNQFFNLRQKHLMPDARWSYQLWAFKNFGDRQSMREAWKVVKAAYQLPFQEFMGQYLD